MRRAVLVGTVLLTVSVCLQQPGFASADARASATQSVSSGSWGVQPSPAQLTFAVSVLSPAPPKYLTVTNTGSLALVGTTYALSTSGMVLGTASMRVCSGTWNESAHSCSGSITTLVTTSTTPVSVTGAGLFPANPNDTLRLQVALSAPNLATVTVNITTSVNRSQVRAATTTTS